jgi:hypothetical protein
MSVVATAETVVAEIATWFEQKIRCGEIARHTPAHNQAVEALADLKARIAALFGDVADEAETLVETVTGKPAKKAAAPNTPAGGSAEQQE